MKEKVDLLPQVQEFCRRNELLPEGGRIIVGLSGGPDSLALFDLLHRLAAKYNYTLAAAHLNHGLRGAAADADENAVRCFCEEYDTRLYVRRRDIAAEAAANCQSEEEAGRRARYAFFDLVVRKEAMLMAAEKAQSDPEKQGPWNPLEHHSLYTEPAELPLTDYAAAGIRVAVGHHRNDQAETVLLNLGRGSGIDGLAGMRPQNGKIIRPLLPVSREKIEAYVSWRGLKPCLDASNLEINATRNRIRHQVIPALSEAFGFDTAPSLARAAALLRRDADYLQAQAEQALTALQSGADMIDNQYQLAEHHLPGAVAVLSITAANKLHPAILSRVLRLWYLKSFGDVRDLSARQVAVLLNLCQPGRSGRRASLPRGRVAVREFDNLILLEAPDAAVAAAADNAAKAAAAVDGEVVDASAKAASKSTSGTAAGAKSLEEQPLQVPGITELANGDRFVTRFIVVQNQIVYNSEIWCFQAAELNDAVVRYRRPRDYFKLEGRAHGKSLKKYFCERKVPAGLRGQLPLIARGDTILWIPGVGAASRLPAQAAADSISSKNWVEVRYQSSRAPASQLENKLSQRD